MKISEEKIPEGFPSFTLQPNMQGVEKGHNALLPCRSIGDPEPQIYWLRDAIPVDMTNPRYSLYQGGKIVFFSSIFSFFFRLIIYHFLFRFFFLQKKHH